MAKQLEGVEFVRANEAARAIAEAAIVAYWMDSRELPDAVKFQQSQMRGALKRLCDLMGLRLVEGDPAPLDRVMLASAAAMIPEDML